MTLGATAIRGLVGPLFVGHGTQKLFGWFGGDGLEATTGTMEALELRPPRRRRWRRASPRRSVAPC